MAQTASIDQLESALEKLAQYGQLYIAAIPEPAGLFCRALSGRLDAPLLLTELDDLARVQQVLATALGCSASPEALLTAVRALASPRMVIVQAKQVSLPVLQYLMQLSAISDAGFFHLPMVVLETPALSRALACREGQQLLQRFALSFSIETSTRRGPLLALAMLVLLGTGAGFGYQVGWRDWSGEAVADAPAAAVTPVTTSAPGAAPHPAVKDEPLSGPHPLSAEDRQQIAAAIEGWRQGWENRNWSQYAGSYIPRYLPMDDDLSHEEWVSWRRARIERPAWIRIGVEQLKLFPLDYYQVRVTFRQRYEAPDYADSSIKELYLVRLREGWKINAERSLR